MSLIGGLLDAISLAFGMFWEILWALVLGFALSAAVQAVVSKAEMTRLLPDDSPRSLGIACGLGAASSSCSYAGCPRQIDLPQGGRLQCGYGLRVRLDQPRHRAWDHHGDPVGLGIHVRGVRGRAHHDRAARAAV